MRIFTHTQGRTGTAWLAEFFRRNTDWECWHERLRPEDHGWYTPGVREMRMYNHYGAEAVRSFWINKLKLMPRHYVETAHMLCKAGLNDYRDKLGDHCLIHLYRPAEQVVESMVRRGDYLGHGNHWLWYLDPEYPRNLIRPEPFYRYGNIGLCAWYWAEIEARKPTDAISVSVSRIAGSEDLARKLLERCGVDVKTVVLPERKNASSPDGNLVVSLRDRIFEVSEIARAALKQFRK